MTELNRQLSYLYGFSRQINELDFAVSLGGEFRGMQDAGWATTITANEVFRELSALSEKATPFSTAEYRVLLMLYCQLAEAGGVYESLKNIMGVVTLKPYILWPFQDLVRVKKAPSRIIGPNANATFRDLASSAKAIGMSELSSLLEIAFRDDIRNGVSHADYVLWNGELRLRNRNGGNARKLTIQEVNAAVTRGMAFFQILQEYNSTSVKSFHPPREIVGRFSANFPAPWTVSFDPETGRFSIKGSSPGMVTTPEYDRQININGRLGGKVLATYSADASEQTERLEGHIAARGFEPAVVLMDQAQMDHLVEEANTLGLWDARSSNDRQGHTLLASPWGFRWLNVSSDFDEMLESEPLLDFQMAEADLTA